jgi:hypothetical protein
MSDVTTTTTTTTTTEAPAGRLRRFRDWYFGHLAAREDGAAIALVRILLGLAVLLLVVPFVVTDAGPEIVAFAFCDDDVGGYRGIIGTPGIRFFGGARPEVALGLLTAAAVAAVFMVVGLFGRLPVLVAAVTTHIVFIQNSDVSGGGDALLGNALFLLLLANCTQTLSLDARLRTGRFIDPTPIAAWPRKLVLVQLAIVYTVTGVQKLVSSAWTPLDGFSALYQILQSPQWARDPDLVVWTGGWLVLPAALLSIVTIVWEVFFFVVLIDRSWRWLFAVTGVGMHIGILVLMEVGAFSWLSMSFYPAMFAPELAAFLARRVGGAPTTTTTTSATTTTSTTPTTTT